MTPHEHDEEALAAMDQPALEPAVLRRHQERVEAGREDFYRRALEVEARTLRGRLRDLGDDLLIALEDRLGASGAGGLVLVGAMLAAILVVSALRQPAIETLDGTATGPDGVEVELRLVVSYPGGERGELAFDGEISPLPVGSRVRPVVERWTFRSGAVAEAVAVAWAIPRLSRELPLIALDLPAWGEAVPLWREVGRADGSKAPSASPMVYPLGAHGMELVVAVGSPQVLGGLVDEPVDRGVLMERLMESDVAVYRVRLDAQ